MDHAAQTLDAATLRDDPADEGVDSLAFDRASERLREAHLHNRQVEARGLFASFFGFLVSFLRALLPLAMTSSAELKEELTGRKRPFGGHRAGDCASGSDALTR